MQPDDALTRLQEAAVLWSVGSGTPAEVVEAACDCLVAGLDNPTLRILAGISADPGGESDELRRWLGDALAELSLTFFREGSRAGEDEAVRIMARRLLDGTITARDLTSWAYGFITRDGTALAAGLIDLEYAYEIVEAVVHDGRPYPGDAAARVEADVVAEARRLVTGAVG
ncbi:hypothetical protein [Micromonospora sp. WMMD714]|uniref:hypothetical protein n=1 Tax=Micromonospora sp. WMMD714 TaxID=3016097 RepID=UPI00249A5845|nr:hypothetical protein [Micromonospora sp. WMMD714]WFE62408.1 hypothetical protein O7625_03495 [Micromonospora sp. WMMD714]